MKNKVIESSIHKTILKFSSSDSSSVSQSLILNAEEKVLSSDGTDSLLARIYQNGETKILDRPNVMNNHAYNGKPSSPSHNKNIPISKTHDVEWVEVSNEKFKVSKQISASGLEEFKQLIECQKILCEGSSVDEDIPDCAEAMRHNENSNNNHLRNGRLLDKDLITKRDAVVMTNGDFGPIDEVLYPLERKIHVVSAYQYYKGFNAPFQPSNNKSRRYKGLQRSAQDNNVTESKIRKCAKMKRNLTPLRSPEKPNQDQVIPVKQAEIHLENEHDDSKPTSTSDSQKNGTNIKDKTSTPESIESSYSSDSEDETKDLVSKQINQVSSASNKAMSTDEKKARMGSDFHQSIKPKAIKMTGVQALPSPKIRHYDAHVVRNYIKQKKVERQKRNLEEHRKKAQEEMNKKERLLGLYEFQKKVVNAAHFSVTKNVVKKSKQISNNGQSEAAEDVENNNETFTMDKSETDKLSIDRAIITSTSRSQLSDLNQAIEVLTPAPIPSVMAGIISEKRSKLKTSEKKLTNGKVQTNKIAGSTNANFVTEEAVPSTSFEAAESKVQNNFESSQIPQKISESVSSSISDDQIKLKLPLESSLSRGSLNINELPSTSFRLWNSNASSYATSSHSSSINLDKLRLMSKQHGLGEIAFKPGQLNKSSGLKKLVKDIEELAPCEYLTRTKMWVEAIPAPPLLRSKNGSDGLINPETTPDSTVDIAKFLHTEETNVQFQHMPDPLHSHITAATDLENVVSLDSEKEDSLIEGSLGSEEYEGDANDYNPVLNSGQNGDQLPKEVHYTISSEQLLPDPYNLVNTWKRKPMGIVSYEDASIDIGLEIAGHSDTQHMLSEEKLPINNQITTSSSHLDVNETIPIHSSPFPSKYSSDFESESNQHSPSSIDKASGDDIAIKPPNDFKIAKEINESETKASSPSISAISDIKSIIENSKKISESDFKELHIFGDEARLKSISTKLEFNEIAPESKESSLFSEQEIEEELSIKSDSDFPNVPISNQVANTPMLTHNKRNKASKSGLGLHREQLVNIAKKLDFDVTDSSVRSSSSLLDLELSSRQSPPSDTSATSSTEQKNASEGSDTVKKGNQGIYSEKIPSSEKTSSSIESIATVMSENNQTETSNGNNMEEASRVSSSVSDEQKSANEYKRSTLSKQGLAASQVSIQKHKKSDIGSSSNVNLELKKEMSALEKRIYKMIRQLIHTESAQSSHMQLATSKKIGELQVSRNGPQDDKLANSPKNSPISSLRSEDAPELNSQTSKQFESARRQLAKQEQRLQHRRKEAERVLRWQKQLEKEKQNVKEIEKKAIRNIDKRFQFQAQTSSSLDEQSVVETSDHEVVNASDESLTMTISKLIPEENRIESTIANDTHLEEIQNGEFSKDILNSIEKIKSQSSESSIRTFESSANSIVEEKESVEESMASKSLSSRNSSKSNIYSESFESIASIKAFSPANGQPLKSPILHNSKKEDISFNLPTPLMPRSSRHDSSGSDDSITISQSETTSDMSDHESRVLALKGELKQRKAVAYRLNREYKRKQKEMLKEKELSLLKQIEAYDQIIYEKKQKLQQINEISALPVPVDTSPMKPQIKSPRAEHKNKPTQLPILNIADTIMSEKKSTSDANGGQDTLEKSNESISFNKEKDISVKLFPNQKEPIKVPGKNENFSETSEVTQSSELKKISAANEFKSSVSKSDDSLNASVASQISVEESFISENLAQKSSDPISEYIYSEKHEVNVTTDKDSSDSIHTASDSEIKSSAISEVLSISEQSKVTKSNSSTSVSSINTDEGARGSLKGSDSDYTPINSSETEYTPVNEVASSSEAEYTSDTYSNVNSSSSKEYESDKQENIDLEKSVVSDKVSGSLVSNTPSEITSSNQSDNNVSIQTAEITTIKDAAKSDAFVVNVVNFMYSSIFDDAIKTMVNLSRKSRASMKLSIVAGTKNLSPIGISHNLRKFSDKTIDIITQDILDNYLDNAIRHITNIASDFSKKSKTKAVLALDLSPRGHSKKDHRHNNNSSHRITMEIINEPYPQSSALHLETKRSEGNSDLPQKHEWTEEGYTTNSPWETSLEQKLVMQQYPYYYRKIPNKPPPPYTPPSMTGSLPVKKVVEPIKSITDNLNVIVESIAQFLLNEKRKGVSIKDIENPGLKSLEEKLDFSFPIQFTCLDLMFDLVKETTLDLYNERSDEHAPWLCPKQLSLKPLLPKDLSSVLPSLQQSVTRALCSPAPAQRKRTSCWVMKLGHKKRDVVDNIIVREIQTEEAAWVRYDEDAEAVQLQVADGIFDLMLKDAIDGILQLKSRLLQGNQ